MDFGGISLKKQNHLQARMAGVGVAELDFQETFVLSQGKGGQNVNKVSTCVCLVYLPLGIQVKCQKTRSQGLNRYWARIQLVEKLEARRFNEEQKKISEREKLKRQNRKRPKQLKENILKEKHHHSDKKKSRASFAVHRIDLDR